MTCSSSLAKPLPFCAEEITIGTLDNTYSNVFVHFKNLTTGNILILQGATDGDKLLTLETDISFPLEQPFEIYVLSSMGSQERIPITIGSDTVDYVHLKFYRPFDSDGEVLSVANASIELE